MWPQFWRFLWRYWELNSCCWRTIWFCTMFLSCQSQVLKWCPIPQYLRDLQNSSCLEHICQIGNNSHLPHFTKNQVSNEPGFQGYAGIYYRELNSTHSPMPSIATSSSSFPSIINNDIGKWKHSLGLNAQREFVGLKIWVAWTLDWSNLEKIPNWTLDGVGKFNLDFAPT